MEKATVVVVGGGATGVGILRDLAMRGVDVMLIEKRDLVNGASSRYHGLLHSGGRYAVKDQEAVVKDADRLDRERGILLVELRDRGWRQELVDHLLRSGYRHGHAAALLREDVERHVIAVAIDKDNAFRGLAHKFSREGIGIVVLSFKKDLLWWKVATVHCLEDGVEAFLVALLVGNLSCPILKLPTLCLR